MKKLILVLISFFLLITPCLSQKKYAILFGGEDHANPNNPMLAFKSGQSVNQQEAIWNDTYLMWELLIENGFDNDDIIVLYHNNTDYVRTYDGSNLNTRYFPHIEHFDIVGYGGQISDYSSTKANLQTAIANINNVINEEDFLVFFNYSHGSANRIHCNSYNQNNPATYVTANELRTWLAPINCKKLILMQQCFSGSFIDELQDNNTIVMTATNDTSLAAVADEEYYYYNQSTGQFNYNTVYGAEDEFEEYTGSSHNHVHSEWFLHVYNALKGSMPDGNTTYETTYANFPLANADLNNDGFITLDESHQRAKEFDSKQELGYLWSQPAKDDPQLSNSELASKTTIAYPYIITSNIASNKTYKGLIGVGEDIHIINGNTLTIGPNAKLELVNNSNLIVDAGATLVLNNATITGESINNGIVVNGNLQVSTSIFENMGVSGNSGSINITSNSNFTNSIIDYNNGNLTIQNSDFLNTPIRAISTQSTTEGQINNCEVSGYAYSGIYINGHREFTIEDCNIHDNGYNGIYVYNAGVNNGLIKGNIINNNGTGSYAGIRVYNSSVNIELNTITNNRYGIMCLNGSNTSIAGYQFANYPYQTQQIENNVVNQVYSSHLSFPDYFKFNSI